MLAVLLLEPTVLNAEGSRRSQEAGSPQEVLQGDTLTQMILKLRARLDSLEAVLAELQGREAPEEAAAEARDELAALRAAAQARVAEAPAPDTATGPDVLKSRNLNDFNPEISVTGDMRFVGRSPGPQRNNVDLREFTVQFQAPLDPFSNAKLAFAMGESEFSLEEAYGYWTGLPGGLRLDLGRFRQPIGELNRWHLHALPESEYPLVLREYFGEDGLVGDGLGLYGTLPLQSPGGGVHEFWAQVTRAGDEILFQESDRLSYMVRLNNFWQVTDATYFQVGASGLRGENPDAGLEATVFAGDFRLSWVPPARSLHNSFTIRGEVFSVDRTLEEEQDDFLGGYLSATLKASQRWNLGGRFDWVEPFSMPGEHIWAIVPQITYWQSEWVFIRGEVGIQSVPVLDGDRDTESVFGIQIVWSLGPHKHETY
jgi:hypothetical protein